MEADNLWRLWAPLSGGGPIHTNRGPSSSPDTTQAQASDSTVARENQSLEITGQATGITIRPISPGTSSTAESSNVDQDDSSRVSEPSELRYSHNAKRWQLGVGRVPDEGTLEGVFAIGNVNTEGVIFTTV
jgi:hypothetical protein